jgi:hypothetical protein
MTYAKQTKKRIAEYLGHRRKGRFIFPCQFDFDLPENIRKALRRLAAGGTLIKLGQGIFYYPKRFPDGTAIYPTTDEIAHAIAKRDGVAIKNTPQHALNHLGFSTQVPMRPVYLTNGPKKTIKVKNVRIEFIPATPKTFQTKGKFTGELILALKALKGNSLDSQKYEIIRGVMEKETPTNIKHDLQFAPGWARKAFYANGLAGTTR